MAFFQIPEVAKLSGVPEAMVMMAINGVNGIDPVIKKRVFAAMKELSFESNKRAGTGAEKQKGLIAVFSSVFFAYLFPTRVFNGIEMISKQEGYSLHQYATEGSHEYESMLMMSVLKELNPAGIICICIKPEKHVLAAYKKAGIPAVIVDEKVDGYSSIAVDSFRGGFIATEYLIKRGRKMIGFVSGLKNVEGSFNALLRFEGYKKALYEGGLKFDEKKVFETTNYVSEDGVRAMQKFHEDRVKLDAIFCASGDTAATGLLKKMAEYGLKVPGDIAVMGYDDTEVASLTKPALTTMRQPMIEMGSKAFELITVFRKELLHSPREIKLEPELIIRESA